jgi:hypothetical protein
MFQKMEATMPTAPKLNGTLRAFIERQSMFFVATAAPDGRVNVSPKGMDSLLVLSDTHIRWLNVTGSGNETAAHVTASPRMTLMFCAFEGDALILRTYGEAHITHWHQPEWGDVTTDFPQMAGARQVFDLEIDLVQTSCGTGMPLMDIRAQRGPEELLPYYADMGEDGVQDYWRRKNTASIDGAPTGVLPTA